MKQLLTFLAAGLLSLGASAGVISLSGQMDYHNDKITIEFSVAAGSSVSVWTDSWQSGLNFDPQLYLAQGDSILQSDNDGGSLLNAAAGFYDAGLQFTALTDGVYRLVLDASSNDALGGLLSQGFTYDADTPIKLSDWNQPGYDVNKNDQKGGFWSLHLSGVEQAQRVPEPAGWGVVMAGLLALGAARRRTRT